MRDEAGAAPPGFWVQWWRLAQELVASLSPLGSHHTRAGVNALVPAFLQASWALQNTQYLPPDDTPFCPLLSFSRQIEQELSQI